MKENRILAFAARDPEIDFDKFNNQLTDYMNVKATRQSLEQPQDNSDATEFTLNTEPEVRTIRGLSDSLQFNIGGNSDVRSSTFPDAEVIVRKRGIIRNDPTDYRREFKEVYPADRIPLYTYRRMAADSIIGLGQDFLVGLISTLPYTIKCDDSEKKEIITNLYSRHHNYVMRHLARTSWRNGFVFAQKFWRKRKTTISAKVEGERKVVHNGPIIDLEQIKFIDPETSMLRYYLDQRENLHHIEQSRKGKWVRYNRNRILWFALDAEFGNIFGNSKFKRAYQYWHYSTVVFQLSLRHVQKVGSPHLEGRYPLGKTKIGGQRVPNQMVMKQMVKGLVSTGGVSMPSSRDEKGNPEWSIEYKHPSDSSTTPYIDYLTHMDRKKLQSLGIPDAVLITGGNYSETDARVDIALVIINDAVNQIEEAIQLDIIDYLVEYNFGPEWIDQVQFSVDRGGLGRHKLLKEILIQSWRTANSKSGLHPNIQPDFRQMFQELGIDVLTHDQTFLEDENGGNVENQTKTPQDEAQDDEDSNGVERLTPDKRKRDRPSTKDVVKE